MEAVYTLLDVVRGVPEVFGSCYDIRVLLDSTSKMMDGKKLIDMKLPLLAFTLCYENRD
ncbi:myosin-crossreactive antigen [Clostridioides mangenotii]|uniref:Myosin-crossreactive antigen n=2 Tax=Metaclostridioides mangenotii TaxID=1540 RepID=A0ABS4EC07_9FIRM|nr:myosin-crossreactive antigen [Clostridioides mangenotii]